MDADQEEASKIADIQKRKAKKHAERKAQKHADKKRHRSDDGYDCDAPCPTRKRVVEFHRPRVHVRKVKTGKVD
jgi:hypothetical protein